MENQHIHDDFIRKIVTGKGPERAPDGFTDRLMAKIAANPALDDSPLLSKGTWIALILAAAALIVFILFIDIPFFNEFFSTTRIQSVSMNFFSGEFLTSMSAFFKGLNISGITVAIVLAAAGLVVLERLLQRKFYSAKLLMLLS